MGIINRITGFFSRSTSGATPAATGSPARQGGSVWDYASIIGAGADGMRVATVFRCVKFLAESVANLPVEYLRRRGDILTPDASNPLHWLLNMEPCPDMTAFDFWRQAVVHVLTRGNCYIVPVWGVSPGSAPGVERLALCHPDRVSHDPLTGLYTVSDEEAGVRDTFAEADIIHIKGMSRDGRRGLSVLTYARLTASIASEGDRETYDRFVNGGSVRGILTSNTNTRGFGEYADAELNRTAASVDERFRAGERIVALPGDLHLQQTMLTSADMQFLESRRFTVREICRFFGVHPSFVFDDSSNNYKSAEMANVAFLSTTLNPLLRSIEQELTRKLLPRHLWGRRCFRFDRRGIYAADLDSKVRYQTQTIAAGIYSINDWRRMENQPPVDGGDRIFISANLRGIDELTAAPAGEETDDTPPTSTNPTDSNEQQQTPPPPEA